MVADNVPQPKIDRALLCLNDADIDIALRRLTFGRPLLFHIIKNLQAVGVSKIAVSAETIPPELPALVDFFHSQGTDVALFRNGPEAMRFAAQPGALVLQNAAIWVARKQLEQLIEAGQKLVLTLPEDPDFAVFERIDLGRRWAGIAIVDGALAQQSGEIAEGWSIDSFLLRSALQAGYPDRPIVSEKPIDDVVIHAAMQGGQEFLIKRLQPMSSDSAILERATIRFADAAINRFASERWWPIVADWTFPFAATLSVVAAFFGYVVTSFWLGAFALFSMIVRARAREVGYRRASADIVMIASLFLLFGALYLNLSWQIAAIDAAFLALLAFGLSGTLQNMRGGWLRALLSPLVISLWLAAMASTGSGIVAVKLAALAMAGTLFWQALRGQS